MPKLFPTYQEFMDLRNGTKVGVTRVVTKSTSDYVVIPNAYDATGLQVTGTNAANFYLNPNANNVQIDSATAGDEFIVFSIHKGSMNYMPED